MEGPSPADILAGRAVFWDSDDELSPRSDSDNAGRDGEDDSKRGSVPLGPRKGVFSPSTETRQAVIGEDRKGAAVPSPHPRFNRGRGRTNVGRFSAVSLIYQLSFLLNFLDACANASCLSFQYTIPCRRTIVAHVFFFSHQVEHLLRRHLLTNLPANHQASTPAVPSSSIQEESASPSIQQLLLSSVASADDDKTANTPALQSIELDDVLEASFLHDPEDRDATDGGANNAIPPSSDNESGGVRNLSRWDLISVGAFRQTRESWEGARHHPHSHHTPGSSADYGSVMKSSPMASMLWQNGSGSGGSGSGNGRPASAPSTVKGKGYGSGKLAKRRQLMMSASTMSSPLILPLSSSSLGGDRTPVALQPAAAITTKASSDDLKKLHHQQQQQQHQKSRKEQRRERKSMKKKSSYTGPVHQIHAHHHGHHSHHHHPNSKNRSASSTQRSNFFAMGVPPLNL